MLVGITTHLQQRAVLSSRLTMKSSLRKPRVSILSDMNRWIIVCIALAVMGCQADDMYGFMRCCAARDAGLLPLLPLRHRVTTA